MELELMDIHFAYPGRAENALRGVTLRLQPGERVALIGRNGSGKSTLMLHANGSLRPTSGEVRLDGQAVHYDRRSLRILRSNVGLVFQNPEEQLFSASVYQDLSLGPLNLGMSPADARRRVLEVAERCNLTRLLDRPTHALSGGEKARAALAGVLAMDPQFLFADELTNSLDPWMRRQVLDILGQLVAEGRTVILASHDFDLVRAWAERVVWIENGRVYRQGPADLVLRDLELPENVEA
jgi:cobalt/nickel transport system ATP-binding protein